MGLTIHYSMTAKLSDPKNVRHLVEAIRQFAMDLPFKEVGEIRELNGSDAENDDDADESDRWLRIQAGAYLATDDGYCSVAPENVIAFSTWPGEGCESANFGFCTYPAFVPRKGKRRLATGLTGWRWSSFCKTQYASDPACGGVQNFLRCHLCVIKLLDFVKQSGLATVEVSDEGGYWEKRNLEALAKDVGRWNEFVAGVASLIRSKVDGINIQSPITGFPNFEHLEAKGLDRLAELHRRVKRPDLDN